MLDPAAYLTYVISNFPTAAAQNSSGAATPDGTEFIAQLIDDLFMGPMQANLDYAGITPNGVTEAAGASQFLEAIQKGHGIGPGTLRGWEKKDDPSVTGDRVILLTTAKQGILKAVYPDLDAAVYVGDPDNPTKPYYYHADDAPGTVRNTAGAYLILPPGPADPYIKQYSEADGNFTATGTGWTTDEAVAVPYKTIDGIWRLMFNITGTVPPLSRTTFVLTISGVTFKTLGSLQGQSISGFASSSVAAINRIFAASGSNTLNINHASVSTSEYAYSGDVELDSKPTWADDKEFTTGITY